MIAPNQEVTWLHFRDFCVWVNVGAEIQDGEVQPEENLRYLNHYIGEDAKSWFERF